MPRVRTYTSHIFNEVRCCFVDVQIDPSYLIKEEYSGTVVLNKDVI